MAPRDNKIFLTCDASDWRTGGVLSFGLTWEDAQPVAYDLAQLIAVEKYILYMKRNYWQFSMDLRNGTQICWVPQSMCIQITKH